MTLRILTITFTLTTVVLFSCNLEKKASRIIEKNPVSINLDTLPNLQQIVESLEKGKRVESSHIGEAGSPSKQWNKYIQLKKVATNDQLISLTDHKNPVVRCYAFQALAVNCSEKLFAILIKHLNDTSTIHTQRGCLVSRQLAGDYFLEVVSTNYIDLEAYKLKEAERQIIDSILIFDKSIRLSAKSKALRELRPESRFYNRVREIVVEGQDNFGLLALSKYENQNDKELIIAKLNATKTNIQYFGLLAVRYFPDESFFPYIQAIHSKEIKKLTGFDSSIIRTLYLAIVQYKNSQSKDLLKLTLNTATGQTLRYHSEFIWLALELFPDSMYAGIQKRIKISQDNRRNLQYWIEQTDR